MKDVLAILLVLGLASLAHGQIFSDDFDSYRPTGDGDQVSVMFEPGDVITTMTGSWTCWSILARA